MKTTLIKFTPEPDQACLTAAVICRQSKMHMDVLKNALQSGHYSLLEHAVFTFEVLGMSRVTSHQLVRHRIASYAQSSQRALEIKGMDWYVTPDSIVEKGQTAKFHGVAEIIKQAYDSFIEAGVPKEDARFILPNATKTSLIITMNARELHSFFVLRCCKRAQWEIRGMADDMLRLCKLVAPVIFTGAGRQCDVCNEPCKYKKEKNE